ncbi:MAG: ABC transporter permease subunit [Candidatus Latescibacteria bacterium]|nr:ABC transporter permease subunit [Candidatus Latescibacterota bacterium]
MARRLQHTWAPYIFVSPFYIFYTLFMIYPLVSSMWTSFHFQRTLDSSVFVGLFNYRILLGDAQFWQALFNTFIYTCGVLLVQLPVALGMALIVQSKFLRGRNFFRLSFFSPALVSGVFVAIIFRQIYNTDSGLANMVLGFDVPWLEHPYLIMPSIILTSVWQSAGFNMLYFLAGLSGIRGELYEAANVDGASPWQRFVNVTLPGLRPITIFVVVISIINSLQLFEMPFVLLDGEGPGGHGRTIVMYLYQKFETSELGLACATGWTLAVLIFLVTMAQLHLMRAFREEDA